MKTLSSAEWLVISRFVLMGLEMLLIRFHLVRGQYEWRDTLASIGMRAGNYASNLLLAGVVVAVFAALASRDGGGSATEADQVTEIEVFHLDRAVAAGHWQGGHGLHGDDFIKGDSEATGESVGFRVKQESFHRLSRGQELEFKFEEGKAGACRVGYGELVATGRQGGPVEGEIEGLAGGRSGEDKLPLHRSGDLELIGAGAGIPNGVEVEGEAGDPGRDGNAVGFAAGDRAEGVGGHWLHAAGGGGDSEQLPTEDGGNGPAGGGGDWPPAGAGRGFTDGRGDHFVSGGAGVDGKGAQGFELFGAEGAAEKVEFELLRFLGGHIAKSVPLGGVGSLSLLVIHFGHHRLQ